MSGGGEHPRSGSRVARVEDRLAARGGAIELLRLPACLFGCAAAARGGLYDMGLLASARLDAAVISVGNLSVGGTGKTPMVVWLAGELERRGRKVGLVSRGYRRKPAAADRGGVEGPNDEARMVQELLPRVRHEEDADRVRAGRALIAQGCDALVLDDAFQHRRIARDLDLVTVDALRPWGLARDASGDSVRALLPRGLLREAPAALARADLIAITRCDQVPAEWLARLEADLETHAPGLPRILCRHAPRALRGRDGVRSDPRTLAGRDVALASGIGNPEAFRRSVIELGARVVAERRFPDHHAFVRGDFVGIEPQGDRLLVVTAKDAVKLAGMDLDFRVLDVALEIQRGAAVLEACLDAVLDAHAKAAAGGRLP